jgi:RHS repeat-associated protein
VRHGLTSGPVTIVPHSNWRGQYHAGSYTDGAVAGNSRLDLREVRWPAENAGAYLNPLRPFRRDAPWMGSLVQSSEDASGLMYRRNRYYDPKTGRFTQEDPIGLAGGLNTYGFADGDPVSYEDPYGLCVDGVTTLACLYAAFEVASTLYDVGDLAVTGFRYARGRASKEEVAITGAGVVAGVFLAGGGYGRAGRAIARNTDQAASQTSRAARREAMRQQGIPTSRSANRQVRPRQAPADRQFQYDAPNGRVNTVTHHSPDADHPNPHWEAGTAKQPQRTDPGGRLRYGNEKSKVEYQP